jgi:hypothetical protein
MIKTDLDRMSRVSEISPELKKKLESFSSSRKLRNREEGDVNDRKKNWFEKRLFS